MKKIFLSLCLVLFFISFASALNYLDTHPVSYYTFNDTAEDFPKGTGITLTATGVPPYVAGKLGSAVWISQGKYYSSSVGNTNWSFGTGDFTVAFWEKINPNLKRGGVHNFGTWAVQDGWGFYVESTGAVTFTKIGADIANNASIIVNDSSFKRLIWTRTGSNNTLWVNGSAIFSFTDSTDFSYAGALVVGNVISDAVANNITIDDLQIYKGYAWNVTDVTLDWNNGAGREWGGTNAITLNSPIDNSFIISSNIIFNATTVIPSQTLKNSTISVWRSNNTLYNETTNLLSNIGTEDTLWNISIPMGAYKWNVYSCSNTHVCLWATSNNTFYSPNFTESFSTTLTEGETTNMLLNLTFENIDTNILSYLNWNNTYYQPNKYIYGNNVVSFIVQVTVPIGAGSLTGNNISHYWRYYLPDNSLNATTATQNQTVYSLGVDNCVAFTTPLLNFTLYDENTQNVIDGTTLNGTIELQITLYDLSRNNQLATYSKTFNGTNNASICINGDILGSSQVSMDIVGSYIANNYVQEFYYTDNETIGSSSIPKFIKLYDLPLTDSTTFLFKFTNENGLTVPDAIIHTYRKYIGDGLFREVERSKQDNNGETHIHLIEEDVIYYYAVSLMGSTIYTSDVSSAKCVSTPCQIILSAVPIDTNWSIFDNEGGKYAVTSNKTDRTVAIDYDLGNELAFILVALYKYSNNGVTFIDQVNATATGGTFTLDVPVSYGNVTFFVSIFKNNHFIKSEWVDFTRNSPKTPAEIFGTMGAILGGLVVLTIILMSVAEGIMFIVFTLFAVTIISIMGLVELNWMALISLICAGGIIIFKLMKRRQNA